MKNIFLKCYVILFVFLTGCFMNSCDLENLKSSLTNAETVAGLKEALRVSTDTSVSQTNKVDGFFKNQLIKILLPEEATTVITVLSAIPGGKDLVDNVILKMNRAAEEAAAEAKPIFIDAITSITFDDAKGILMGGNNAATEYLKGKTFTQLKNAFAPKINNALSKVGATTAWETMMNAYNQIPLVTPVNTNLGDYTTGKALDGMFTMVAVEEGKIRTNTQHQVTELLRKVFGSN